MFEWLSGNMKDGEKSALNALWNIFGGGILAVFFAFPFAAINAKGDSIKFFEYLFTPFG